ncbi:MAG: TatD family hydrolase [Flavobacteriales bacterium]|nr:TatD family hydrolase [Flavobacteriia bacterium]NCP04954.1 TatD family hydrolase [Flavobacteriales bacterium]PIV93469.1 MAG: hydrolase TatD [Flavobacteriaceae bacterium CG17_big_fil_post_rev_8_21_14_2_50_33_15]PIY09489.1 MAG: hydrolase TatD [Flavobacteriaceae bacterium CG_4_10_14_3_um_filter_33_47]PJB16863.1 MAG: hydrolase TatD [Flavobacteriaceae bacterium CG_4_9_14_3_um_filter_33_16]
MIITDTHTHLYSEAFDEDRKEMIERAIQSNVTRFFIPAIDSTYTESMLQLEKDFPGHMFLMMGLHPTHVKENFKEELKHVETMLNSRTFYAVGEIGIDLYWDIATLQIQQEAFKHQIKLAKQHKLPIVIHSRESFDEIFEILEDEKGDDLFGIFHCFSGNLKQAQQAISYQMKLGIGGVATFKNGKIDQFLNQIDLKHMVLETDAPYLAPAPFRGKRNESSYLIKVLEKLSIIYNKPIEDIAAITTQNSKDIFNI